MSADWTDPIFCNEVVVYVLYLNLCSQFHFNDYYDDFGFFGQVVN